MSLQKLSNYFQKRDRKRLDAVARSNADGLPEMTVEEIKLACLENDGYETPELNEKLYLHFKGFKRIENLDLYTGCKAIWLDSNGFTKIENLESMKSLRCLYLSKNLISAIENLDTLENLNSLDLSYNRITTATNVSGCPNLETLNLSHNQLTSPDSIRHLQACTRLTTLDLSNNKLPLDEDFIKIFKGMPTLTTLSLNGNELTKLPHFRKRMIASVPQLGYLDRPIDEIERICALAFMEGGSAAESAARNQWKEAQTKTRQDEVQSYKIWQEAHREKLRAQRAARNEPQFSPLEFSAEECRERDQLVSEAVAADKLLCEVGVEMVAKAFWSLADRASDSASGDLDLLQESLQLAVATERSVSDLPTPSPCADVVEIDGTSGSPISVTSLPDESVGKVAHAPSQPVEPTEDIVQASIRLFKERVAGPGLLNTPSLARSNVNSLFDILDDDSPALSPSMFWTESMDRRLQDLVLQFRDSYEDIAASMNVFIQSDQFSDDDRKTLKSYQLGRTEATEIISAEACRARWSELDAALWGCAPTGNRKSPTQIVASPSFKVYAQMRERGEPVIQSYDDINRIVTKSGSVFMPKPDDLPCVDDDTASDDDDDASRLACLGDLLLDLD